MRQMARGETVHFQEADVTGDNVAEETTGIAIKIFIGEFPLKKIGFEQISGRPRARLGPRRGPGG